jgi:PTH1 family peptidyl-tRNA hydrolase
MRIMKLIVGLGNPGERHSGNRHNIGFMAVDEIARGYGFAPWKKRFQGYTAEGQIGLEKCILLKPSTYMNESGRAVGEAMRFYKLPLGDVIVIHDEIDLKPGAIRVKRGGGNAGHNGLKSISAHTGNDYMRVRLGIDHPGDKALVANYVLEDFAKSDRDWLLPLLEGVARGMAKLVEGSEAAFLAEAARGRKRLAPAAKMNGAAPLPNGKAHVSSDEERPAPQVIAAPAQPLAAQEAPERRQEEAISEESLAPQASGPVVDGALAAAAAHEAELFRAQATEPLFEIAPEDRAKEADAIRAPRRLSEPRLEEISTLSKTPSQGNFFTRWFRTRVRGAK